VVVGLLFEARLAVRMRLAKPKISLMPISPERRGHVALILWNRLKAATEGVHHIAPVRQATGKHIGMAAEHHNASNVDA
jgi:hypothetical protein